MQMSRVAIVKYSKKTFLAKHKECNTDLFITVL